MTTPALALSGIRKAFGPVLALDGADLVVHPGSIHALLGENGAGKSTLMRIVAGLLKPDAGTVAVDGIAHRPEDAADARRRGIAMVHQHLTTIAAFTVWENIALATGWPLADARQRAVEALRAQGVDLDPDARVEDLTVGLRQQLELQKALASGPRLLLLDEPTGTLTPPEVKELFRTIKAFVADGGSVVLITHKLDEALEQAGAITVLRQGKVTMEWRSGDVGMAPSRSRLVEAMLGGTEIPSRQGAGSTAPGQILAVARGIDLRAGEVVGIAGVEGNGQRELLRGIATTAFIPEDRTTEGLIPEFTLTENLALTPASSRGWIDWRATRDRMDALIRVYQITTEGPDAIAGSLSGGNQQKVVVARALEGAPRVVVAENPARGLDVHAAAALFGRLREAAASGAAVIFHSTDLDEVVTWADRIVVMAAGEVIHPPAAADRATLGSLMVSRRSAS